MSAELRLAWEAARASSFTLCSTCVAANRTLFSLTRVDDPCQDNRTLCSREACSGSAPEAALQRHQRHPAAALPVQPAAAAQRFPGCKRAMAQRRHLSAMTRAMKQCTPRSQAFADDSSAWCAPPSQLCAVRHEVPLFHTQSCSALQGCWPGSGNGARATGYGSMARCRSDSSSDCPAPGLTRPAAEFDGMGACWAKVTVCRSSL